jgi:hypothetical protein
MATGIYDPEEEALLRRAHEYATGQVPYENEEDLLNQAQSYSQNPRYWNQAGAAPMAYDPTLEPADAYPGAVPQNEFMQPSPYQIPEQPASYEDGFDQPTPEEGMGYPQPEPNAPQGEFAVNRPGFIYKGDVAGEAAARYAWNEAGPAEPEIPDRTGNYIAQQRALEFDRRKAQAEAQREIEFAYHDAKTAGQMAAVKASQQHLQDRMIAEGLANGMPREEILLRYGVGGNSPTASASMYRAMQNNQAPVLRNLGTDSEGRAIQVVQNGQRFTLVKPPNGRKSAGLPDDPQARDVFDAEGKDTGYFAVPNSDNTGFVYKRKVVAAPDKDINSKFTMAGEDMAHPGATHSGPFGKLVERFGSNTNAPPDIQEAYRQRQSTNASPGTVTETVTEVQRNVGGRLAVFDEKTKKFIRWADGKP